MSSAKSAKRKATGDGTRTAKKPVRSTGKKPRKPKGMMELTEGQILTDLVKKQWRLGKLLGWGGFGALYLASPETSSPVTDKAEFVAKVEPHTNGPLFSELSFYHRVAKPELIQNWMKSHKLKHVGVPPYIASGNLDLGSVKMRFMIMERFSHDIDKVHSEHNKCFDISTTLLLGLRIIEALEFIHSNEYVHADIKGTNIMLGFSKGKTDQVYLIDYGLAYRFNPDGNHKAYKEDPKCRHNGTVEVTSRDAHNGAAPSRRGDLEILGYVMLHWLCNRLPWEDNLNDKEYVMQQKIMYMENITKLMKDCHLQGKASEVQKFLEYVAALKYEQEPDYDYIKKLFRAGLKKHGAKDDGRSVRFKGGSASMSPLEQNGSADHDEEEKTEETFGRAAAAKAKSSSQKRAPKRPAEEKSASVKSVKRKPSQTKTKDTSKRKVTDKSPEKTKTLPPKTARRRGRPLMVDCATSPINWGR